MGITLFPVKASEDSCSKGLVNKNCGEQAGRTFSSIKTDDLTNTAEKVASSSGVALKTSFEVAEVASGTPKVKMLDTKIISYEDFVKGDEKTVERIKAALKKDGIVGIRGVPGYMELRGRYIAAAKAFGALDHAIKSNYVPDRNKGQLYGFEAGTERFKKEDGTEVVDAGKYSYYSYINKDESSSEYPGNVWPEECDLKTPCLEMGHFLLNQAIEVLRKIGYDESRVDLNKVSGMGRMLDYQPNPENTNPLWCGAHFDHSLFTALLTASYFKEGRLISEPSEAGLFIQRPGEPTFYKVVSDDPEVMLFQVGEFAQLDTDGAMQATKHRVNKALDGDIRRITMAVFVNPDFESVIESHDVLAKDSRYLNRLNSDGEVVPREDGKCQFLDWHLLSFKRYQK